ncbi:MAG: TyrR/PhhR family helix-turn-helix DNA-binding protein [Hydrogenophaga sp.]|uniref:TyrR/PhhR family helix-turn-helix DNA-binding protein n=1 Tax=Hydrogenophaga sp. TaxID=1904254 RepID=UPI003D9BB89C
MSDAAVIDTGDLELADAATAGPTLPDDDTVTSLDEAVSSYESALLQRLWPKYPSTRRLAERLGTSHSAIAARLRKYGITN